ncbi:hypothetical protein [Picosynechococcus sp. PCC 8807]|uniref:hypothetical protein n=1 Tax=Picosynechococcus sp. PCC 8807 TaxID=195248 RepID=UPI000810B699|nr:hypothetical protein [Picosynechococcus sp. PCC 8807]ANV91073.1 hypothetical protein AWQ24_10730 [Picosynechococcus sp. PCC 8807]
MVKAIEQVRRDLATISERVVGVREALTSAYGDYLNCLGDSLKRQLVLASYQLCTQIYPQKFLQLSHSQRQALQQELRQLGIDLQTRLHTLLTEPEDQPSEAESEVMAEFFVDAGDMENSEDLDQELFEVFESLDQAIATDEQPEEKIDKDDQLPAQLEDKEKRRELSQLAERIADSLAEMMQGPAVEVSTDENSPDYWLEWCKTTEKRIRRTLNQVSQTVNHQLQDAKILPENIPTTVLDMAIQADNQQHGGQMPSHLVNVVIEAELGKKKKKRKHRTHLTAVHLKVSEVEFTEPEVSAQRRRLREQVDKLRNLQKYYQKAKQDLAIAEAEAAWRASWYENS